jgi:iron complex outermembrane receptor protein
MKKILYLSIFLMSIVASSQIKITGVIKDETNNSLPGASILEKGTSNGTSSDLDGKFTLEVRSSNSIIVISFIGFESQEITVANTINFSIILKETNVLDEIVLVGSRTPARSNTKTPLPIDILPSKDITNTGQSSFDQVLQYKVPSFNVVNIPVSDATSLFDPYEIRNLGPSRTLILINGKRKNLSALAYTYGIAGRGETGADISAIPIDAIKRVEILRDGASAHYGSDAIAGVVNIILKDNYNKGSVTTRTGVTSEGDGELLGFSLNNGESINNGKGFLNYTVDFSKSNRANRPGLVNALGEATDFGANITDVQEFLSRHPDAGNVNATPKTISTKFLLNGGYELSEKGSLYFNAAYVYKAANSFANYRTPYWRTLADYPYLGDFFPAPGTPNNYDGYIPTFDGILNDYNASIGFKGQKNEWNYDVSYTIGGNLQKYTVRNSHNGNSVLSPSTWVDANNNGIVDAGELTQGFELYRENSPITFDVGGTKFTHGVGNIDVSRIVSDKLSIAFGTEFRFENFEVIAGELASYDGGGSDSFAGSRPENSKTFNRYNWGGYFDVSYNATENFLLNGTIRTETYSDFGSAFVWKLSSRYNFTDNFTLRGSVSTGFRAPTLHQIYSQKLQYSFVAGQGIQVTGLINNISPEAKLLEIPQLSAEKSTNFTLGIGAKLNKDFQFTIDYYNIGIKDRVILSYEISGTAFDANGANIGTTDLDAFLRDQNLQGISFFINGLDTRTSGLDVVFNYKNIAIHNGTLALNLSGNYVLENKQVGATKTPQLIADAGQTVVNKTQESVLFTSRPETKWILGANYTLGKFGATLNNTYFGKATFHQQGLSNDIRTEFIPKIITDLGVNYKFTDKIMVSLNINNLLNITPEWNFKAENAAGQALLNDPVQTLTQSNLITFNQRYSTTTYDGFHFSQFGTMYNLSLNYQF